ncbi:uncharacterized protein LOC143934968 [Lithobates pipiens]
MGSLWVYKSAAEKMELRTLQGPNRTRILRTLQRPKRNRTKSTEQSNRHRSPALSYYKESTMTTTYSLTILFFVSLTSIVSGQTCKWLHRNQEVVNRQILQNFNQMIPAEDSPGVCLSSNFSVPDIKHLYNISKVESAAIAVREVANQTIQFYRRNEEKLDYHRPAWERLQELLYYQEQQLSDCIPEGAENHLFIESISQQFITLQMILEEQDDKVCAQRAVHAEIQRNLLLASQLSSHMRREHLISLS